MKAKDLNHYAWSGTADELVKLLKAYGDTKWGSNDERLGVEAVQAAVSGFGYRESSWDGHIYFDKPFKTPAVEKAAKDAIMIDFYASKGVFAPKPDTSKELTDKFNEQAKQIEELKKMVAEQQKTIDTLKKNPPEYPSAH